MSKSWALRKIKSKGLDLKSLVKVKDFKNPFDCFEYKKAKREKLRQELEMTKESNDISSEAYVGLTAEQADIIQKITTENSEILLKFKNPAKTERGVEQEEIPEFKIQQISTNLNVENQEEEKNDLIIENIKDSRYSQFIEKNKEIVKKTDNKRQEIILKSAELQEWATKVLDMPEELIPDLIPNVPDADRSTTVPIHESVDIGALDVLLNACKPSLFDSKPSIRLNVIQEVAPPDTLVSHLQKTLGVTVVFKKKSENSNKGFGYKIKEIVKRPKYGNWYIKPSLWSEKMEVVQDDTLTSQKKSHGLHEMIQNKLEEIKLNQEREDAEILAENSMKKR